MAAYALLLTLVVLHHEPWADEAQAWLLGRDASLGNLWGGLLHYEGTPGLWQTLVHLLVHLGLPYSAYNFICAALGFAAVYLLVRECPLPLYIRLSLPFTYYVFYQYAVIARSYALVAPLLFAIAALYTRAAQKPILITTLLCLLAAISVHGFILSASIWAALCLSVLMKRREFQPNELRKLLLSSLTYWLVLGFLTLCAWPAKDVAFAENRGFANLRLQTLQDVIQMNLGGGFTGYWVTALAIVALSLPFLWRGGGWVFLLLSSAGLFLFGTIVYTQVWHFGLLFLGWLFAIWISAYKTRVTKPVIGAILAVIAVQCYWTIRTVYYDWTNAYSGSRAAAAYLREKGVPPGGLYAVGFSSTAVQPYFRSNIYSNFNHGYWDWSKRNMANDADALVASLRREEVLVGYKNIYEKERWDGLLPLLGYQLERRFGGGTFWQTGVFELESFEIYRKTGNAHAASSVAMGDRSRASQLLDGFYSIESGSWRWSAKSFSVLLTGPPGSDRNGAELNLHLYIPEPQFQRLGTMRLSANAGGDPLPAHTYAQAGASVYSAHVPAQVLRSGVVVVKFQLDKAATHLAGDARELGLVTTSVSLDPAK